MEEWRPIAGWPGYEVSSLGAVRNGAAGIQPQYAGPGAVGRFDVTRRGDFARATLSIATVVLEAFHGEQLAGEVALHTDGDMRNNAASNLRWGSRAERVQIRRSARIGPRGESHGNSKLTEHQVRAIRRESGKRSRQELAALYGLTPQHVGAILRRDAWAHIED